MTVQDRLRGFIIDELRWDGPGAALTNDYPLIERRVVDSMGIYQIVTFIEGEFGIEVFDEELVPEHFGSIDEIALFIEAKRAS